MTRRLRALPQGCAATAWCWAAAAFAVARSSASTRSLPLRWPGVITYRLSLLFAVAGIVLADDHDRYRHVLHRARVQQRHARGRPSRMLSPRGRNRFADVPLRAACRARSWRARCWPSRSPGTRSLTFTAGGTSDLRDCARSGSEINVVAAAVVAANISSTSQRLTSVLLSRAFLMLLRLARWGLRRALALVSLRQERLVRRRRVRRPGGRGRTLPPRQRCACSCARAMAGDAWGRPFERSTMGRSRCATPTVRRGCGVPPTAGRSTRFAPSRRARLRCCAGTGVARPRRARGVPRPVPHCGWMAGPRRYGVSFLLAPPALDLAAHDPQARAATCLGNKARKGRVAQAAAPEGHAARCAS